MATFLVFTYILTFVLQVVLQVKAIRKDSKKLWISLFFLELIPMLIAMVLKEHYDNLPGYGFMPGLSYLGEVLFSFYAAVVYGLFFLASACIYIVLEEKKKNIVPVFALAGFLLVVLGCYYLGEEIICNYGKTESAGTIVGYEDVHTGGGIEQWPVIEFSVGEERYRDDYPMFEGATVGKELTIYYYLQGDTYRCTLSKRNNKPVYIPAFLLGGFAFFIRRKKRSGGRNGDLNEMS